MGDHGYAALSTINVNDYVWADEADEEALQKSEKSIKPHARVRSASSAWPCPCRLRCAGRGWPSDGLRRAGLLRRTFALGVLTCTRSGAKRVVLAVVTHRDTARGAAGARAARGGSAHRAPAAASAPALVLSVVREPSRGIRLALRPHSVPDFASPVPLACCQAR